jgi:transposase InsO family protein
MGQTMQAESHTVELPFVYAAERDSDVLEYWDQPGRIRLVYRSKAGRRVVTGHTPDYFELRRDSAGWVECKPEERLQVLAQEAPNRYRLDQEGRWACPPGEEYAAQYGLTYRIFSSAAINWIEQRNWLFLADYLQADCPLVDDATRRVIQGIVAGDPGLTLAQLYQRVKQVATSDTINILIATAQIYVDLRACVVAEPEYVPVFRDAAMAEAYAISAKNPRARTSSSPRLVEVMPGTPLLWDGQPWTVGNPTATHISLIAASGVPVELVTSVFDTYVREGRIIGTVVPQAAAVVITERAALSRASPGDLAVANHRYAAIRPYLEDHVPLGTCAPHIPQRTKFLWAKRWREAEAAVGNGYIGLLPARRPNTMPRRLLTDAHLAVLHTILDDHYATYRNKKLRRSYGAFLAACGTKGLYEVSERTFYTQAHRYLSEHALRTAREGNRAAYASRPPQQATEPGAPRHGDRPWELAHIDHTEVDLELRSARTGRMLGKAWLTLMIDAYTRRVLMVYVTYAKPSAVSCLMAVRLCVQRWGRLPRALVTDGGPEFQSTYFETLLAWYKVTRKTRPPAEPKYGAVCERLFGTANTTFIHTLLGNTQVMKNVRQVTPAVNPKTHACWTLGDLYTWLCEWAYDVYDTIDHPALGQSPRDAYAWAESRVGSRDHTRIPYDRDFIIGTLPTTRKGTATVQPGHGVKINSILYWCSAFEDPDVEHTAVTVRYDPFDVGVAYAYLPKDRRWVECRSDHYAMLQGRSERELLLIAEELRKAQRDHGAQATITAKQLAAFGARVEEHEQIMLQRDRDAETRAVLTLIQGGNRSPYSDVTRSRSGDQVRPAVPPTEGDVVPAPKPKLLPRLR